jgi:hypothetical protein
MFFGAIIKGLVFMTTVFGVKRQGCACRRPHRLSEGWADEFLFGGERGSQSLKSRQGVLKEHFITFAETAGRGGIAGKDNTVFHAAAAANVEKAANQTGIGNSTFLPVKILLLRAGRQLLQRCIEDAAQAGLRRNKEVAAEYVSVVFDDYILAAGTGEGAFERRAV